MRPKSALKRECPTGEVFRDREAGRSKGGVKEMAVLEVLSIL